MVNQNKEYYLGLYEKSMPNTLSWEEKLEVVKEAGFDYLEMSIDETEEKLARLDQPVDEIKKAIEKTGVPIKSICLSGHRKYPLGSHDPKDQGTRNENHGESHLLGCKIRSTSHTACWI